MPAAFASDQDRIQAHLERVLGVPLFRRAEKQSAFLRYVVENALAGRESVVREFDIGTEVYQRTRDYDPREDPIVRVEASRLRARLREYYESADAGETIRIELPKGTYLPVFHGITPEEPVVPPVELPEEKPLNIPVQKPQAQPATAGQKWAAVLVLAAIVGFYAFHISRKESSGAVRENSQRVFAQATGLHMQMTPAALRQARLLHETIVRNDPAWARGHSGLAHTYISMISTGGASRAEVAPLALGTAQRALELEPALEDAHSALVRYYRDVAFDLNRVEAVCRTALEKAAEPSQILVNCSAVESMRGNHEIAELWARDAVRSNPKWSESWAALAQALWRAGRAEAAQEPARKALAIDRNSIGARIVLAMTALSRKDIAGAAKAITDSLPANGIDREEWYSYRGAIAAASGDKETAEAMYNRLELRSHTMAVSPVAFARIRLAEADTEAALTLLEEGVRRRDVEAALLLTSPEARPLVGLPRYQAACRALGVPPL